MREQDRDRPPGSWFVTPEPEGKAESAQGWTGARRDGLSWVRSTASGPHPSLRGSYHNDS